LTSQSLTRRLDQFLNFWLGNELRASHCIHRGSPSWGVGVPARSTKDPLDKVTQRSDFVQLRARSPPAGCAPCGAPSSATRVSWPLRMPCLAISLVMSACFVAASSAVQRYQQRVPARAAELLPYPLSHQLRGPSHGLRQSTRQVRVLERRAEPGPR